MKFTQQDIANLSNILNVTSLVGIDALIFSSQNVRGVNADKTCAFIVDKNIPVIEDKNVLGLSKLKILKSRLDLFKLDGKLSIEGKQKANGDFTSLDIKGSNASVQFRATAPSAIKAPISIDDTPMKSIMITKEEAGFILQAEKAMGAKKVTIDIDKSNKVSVQFSDSNNDVFKIDLSNQALSLEKEGAFVNYFFTDVFSPVLKAAIANDGVVGIQINEASAQLEVDGYSLILLSPMDAE